MSSLTVQATVQQRVIDAILSAIAVAGKGNHHTCTWADESDGFYRDRPGLPDASNAVELIQGAADQAAAVVRALAVKRDPAAELNDVLQDDVAALLRAAGLSDHARSASPHEVVRGEVIPAIEQIRGGADKLAEVVEALEALIHYTKACEGLLNATTAGQVRRAEAALAQYRGES